MEFYFQLFLQNLKFHPQIDHQYHYFYYYDYYHYLNNYKITFSKLKTFLIKLIFPLIQETIQLLIVIIIPDNNNNKNFQNGVGKRHLI